MPYTWKQELGDVDIVVPVPKGTRAKDLQIIIGKKKLSVGLKGKDKIMDGELCKEIKMEDSTWTVGMYLAISLLKSNFKGRIRGPRGYPYPSGENKQSDLVGERPYPSSQNRRSEDRTW